MTPIPLKEDLEKQLMKMPELEEEQEVAPIIKEIFTKKEKMKKNEDLTGLEDLYKEIPCKWRIQSINYGKASCVAYVDARDCMDMLDRVVGAANWQSMYYTEDNKLFCRIGILCNDISTQEYNWVWKSDTGSESNVEKEKGQVSDAFKRACVQWGIGRFLYRFPIQKLQTQKHTNGKEYVYCPEKKKLLFDGDEITRYINWKLKNK